MNLQFIFKDIPIRRALSTGAPTICAEPVRLADKPWEKVESQEFACKPEVVVAEPRVHAVSGANATLQCRILGNPPPAVKWVLNGRVIKNRSAPLAAKPGQLYLIQSVATREGLKSILIATTFFSNCQKHKFLMITLFQVE